MTSNYCQRSVMLLNQLTRLNISKCPFVNLQLFQNNYLYTIQKRLAGHSKWQNIRHTKEAKDTEKAKLYNKVAVQIRKAVAEAGPDPKSNNRLQLLLNDARERNVPKATIEKAMKKAQNAKIRTSTVEIAGPGNSFFIVNVETDNISNTIHDLKGICKKTGSVIVPEGRTRSVFEIKGIITVIETKDNEPLDSAKALDVAIEAGAEEVQESSDDDNKPVLKFICDPNDFFSVKKHIESSVYVIEDASLEYIPVAKVQLNDESLEVAEKLCSMLEDLPTVAKVYDNIE